MSQHKPADIVREIYAAFGRRDIGAIVAALAEGVSWTVDGPKSIPYAGRYKGRAAVQGWFETVARTVNVTRFDVERVVAQDGTVVGIGTFAGTVPATGKPYATRFAHVWTVRDGAVTAFEDFLDTAGAAAAHAHRRGVRERS